MGSIPTVSTLCDSRPSGRLAHYKIPRYVLCIDEFPMTVTGKVRKAEMRDESIRRLGLAAPTRDRTEAEVGAEPMTRDVKILDREDDVVYAHGHAARRYPKAR